MVHRGFSIFDQMAKAFLPPFFLPTEAMALRTFGDCCNSKDHQFGAHPADYTLFELGFFDDSKGVFTPHSGPVKLAVGVELLKPVPVDPDQVPLPLKGVN